MGACRENRKSENTLNGIINSVRNVDKLLWHGQKWAVEDLQEYVDSIKRDLDFMMEQFKQEMGVIPTPPKHVCGCQSRPSMESLLHPIGDLVDTPITPILGDKDFPCDDPKCDCHKE